MNSYTNNVTRFDNLSNLTRQKSTNNSIYSSVPRVLKVNPTQFEIIFPFVDIYERNLPTFMAFEKTHVVVEFGVFVKFVVDNIREGHTPKKQSSGKFVITMDSNIETKENSLTDDRKNKLFDGILFAYEDIHNHAMVMEDFLDSIRDNISEIESKLGHVPSRNEVYGNLSPKIKKELMRLNSVNRRIFSELWSAFIINVALLNVKSMVLCGEHNKNNLSKSNKPVIPLRFIPKLGSELSVLSKEEYLTLTEVQNRIILNDFKNDYDGKILISSLKKSEEEDFLDYKLDGEPVDVFRIAESFGYSYDRYFEASQVITDSASGSVTALEDCENYLDNFSDYIEVLGDLYSNLNYYNSSSKTIILDFEL